MDEVQDDVREKMGILFSRAIHLYAKRVPTVANPKSVMQYSDYFSNQVVQVCWKDKIVEERAVNEVENKIYQELSTGQGLDKDDREYLRDNYSKDEQKRKVYFKRHQFGFISYSARAVYSSLSPKSKRLYSYGSGSRRAEGRTRQPST